MPPHLQNQIAAGEVVERPSSVVKELVENSLDAGADRVQVQLEGGGLGLILVQDNGRGMDPGEMRLSLTRHATSKIAAVEDLDSIATFGFRGEALPSIASVSRLRMASRSQDSPDASYLDVHFGEFREEGPAAMTQGTRIEVRDLFGNVPARLKFMKSQATEVRRCQETLERMALARLDAGFKFSVGERVALRFVPGQNLLARLAAVWPPAVTQGLTPVEADMHGCRVTGFAGLPHVGQARPDRMLFYVNGRPVQDRVLLRAVREAYKGRMLSREYPVAALFITTGPGDVDVNVHPAKTEVRFRDEGLMFTLVRTGVARALDLGAPSAGMRAGLDHAAPSVRRDSPDGPKYATYREYLTEVAREETGEGAPEDAGAGRVRDPGAIRDRTVGGSGFDPGDAPAYLRRGEGGFAPGRAGDASPAFESRREQHAARDSAAPRYEEPRRAPARSAGGVEYLGQVAGTYLVLRLPGEGLALLDQHAAHERVLYERMRASHSRGESQPLAIPFEMSLHPAEQKKITGMWAELSALGFSMESARPGVVAVRGIPPLLSAGQAKEFLREAVAGKARSMEDLWAVMSCKGAIKAGDRLAGDEALALVEAWSAARDRDYCPHGRPVVVTWDRKELEKLFKRRK
ncbi:MAG: DNA mismatch repair endonuclease MutL [Thermodesulfobacteriota bacterium]